MLVSRTRTVRPRAPLLQLDVGFGYELCRIAGRLRSRGVSFCGVNLEIPACSYRNLSPLPLDRGMGQRQVGSLTGAVAS